MHQVRTGIERQGLSSVGAVVGSDARWEPWIHMQPDSFRQAAANFSEEFSW